MIISISQTLVMKSYHYFLSVTSTQFLEKTHETSQEPQIRYRYKSAISFTLKKEELPPLLSVCSPLGSFTDSAKSSARVRKSYKKTIFPISQPNIHNSVSSQKSNVRIEIPVKFNMTRPTNNSSKISRKVYLGNAYRVLHKDVLKPRSIATYNLTHKDDKIPHVKLDVRKPSNNQSSTLCRNVIWSSTLNIHKRPLLVNIRKTSRSDTKLSHLKARNSAHQKLHYDRDVDTNNVSENHLRYKSNHLWWKYHVKRCLFLFSYLCHFLLLLIFLTNKFDLLVIIISKFIF